MSQQPFNARFNGAAAHATRVANYWLTLCDDAIALRAHLGPLLATTSSAPSAEQKPATASSEMNIDPAISGPQQQQIPATASPHTPQPVPMSVSPVMQQVQVDGQQQQQVQNQQHSGGEGQSGETPKKGNKRELSTSKRAAQNRAAQVR